MIERAFAKLNLVLDVGAPRPDGMHPLRSLFASIDLADTLTFTPAERDRVVCAGIDERDNLARRALDGLRAAGVAIDPVEITIEKRIPVAAGLGGGSADAAAVLRRLGAALDRPALMRIAAGIGADVPSQVEPAHAVVTGIGERVEPVALPPLAFVLVPHPAGLSTPVVFAQLDALGGFSADLDPEPLRLLAAAAPEVIAAAVRNDLEPAAIALLPALRDTLAALRSAGASAARVTGSGPTAFGIFGDRAAAERAASALEGAIVAETR